MNLEMQRMQMLVPVVRDPHFVRFTEEVQRTGIQLHAHLFVRDGQLPSAEVSQTVQARFGHRRYAARILPLLFSLPRLSYAFRKADVIYAMGFDLMLLARLALLFTPNSPTLVYHVADIRTAQAGDSLVSRILRGFERWMVRRASNIVVTSQAFTDHYFGPYLGVEDEKVLLYENKLYEDRVAPRNGVNTSPATGDRLTIGYFGVLRCRRTWEIIKQTALQGGDRVHIRVRGIPDYLLEPVLEREAAQFDNISLEGRYDPRTDLAGMYDGLDLVFTTADYELPGPVRNWPRTNRFYEACAYRVPMLDNQGSANSEVIKRERLGLTIPYESPSDAANKILAVTRSDVEGWRENLRALPKERFFHWGDVKELVERLG